MNEKMTFGPVTLLYSVFFCLTDLPFWSYSMLSASESPDFMALYKLVFNFNFNFNLCNRAFRYLWE